MFFIISDPATTEIYTLSLHDALPIWRGRPKPSCGTAMLARGSSAEGAITCGSRPNSRACSRSKLPGRSEEHTSELQSLAYLVCRLLLEKKKMIRSERLLNTRMQTRLR